MKHELAYTLLLSILLLVGCSNAQKPSGGVAVSTPERKILIVYLSRTNNTKAVAEIVQDEIGGHLVGLELEKPYPENYQQIVAQVGRENETRYLPPLKTKIDLINEYDLIFVGFPTWGMQLPPPVKSFLRQYDLKGKTVVPFNTNAGYGVGSAFTTFREFCSGCTISEGLITKGGIERDGILLAIKDTRADEVRDQVRKWLKRIEVTP